MNRLVIILGLVLVTFGVYSQEEEVRFLVDYAKLTIEYDDGETYVEEGETSTLIISKGKRITLFNQDGKKSIYDRITPIWSDADKIPLGQRTLTGAVYIDENGIKVTILFAESSNRETDFYIYFLSRDDYSNILIVYSAKRL